MTAPLEIRATYLVQTKDPDGAMTAICRGQSVGNPSILTSYETKDFLDRWCVRGKITHEVEDTYLMVLRFPQRNFGREGVNYLLSVLMGGQCDIDLVQGCRLVDLHLGTLADSWPRSRYGITGIRQLLNVPTQPLICGIIKPKIGLTPRELYSVVEQMVEGGCHVIKEDEILANQFWCPREERLRLLEDLVNTHPVLYLSCITGDGSQVWREAHRVENHGPHFAVHCNVWAGLGTYLDIRQHVSCPIFFQKSGDKVWTTGPFSIDYTVLCQLIYLIGCDFAHVGMYGGYLSEPVGVLRARLAALQTTIPSFSCGMTPETGSKIVQQFGRNVMLTSGGWIHGQPGGIAHAVRELAERALAASPTLAV